MLKNLSLFSKRLHSSHLIAITVVILVAGVGTYFLVASHADSITNVYISN